MATETIKRLVCDVCGSVDGVRAWRVQNEAGRQLTVDLCEKDGSKMLADLFSQFPQGKRGARRGVTRVKSEAEIDRLAGRKPAKKTAKKAPAKKAAAKRS